MRNWLYDRPWIWIVLFLGFLVASSLVVLVIAELNKPVIVKKKTPASHAHPAGRTTLLRP